MVRRCRSCDQSNFRKRRQFTGIGNKVPARCYTTTLECSQETRSSNRTFRFLTVETTEVNVYATIVQENSRRAPVKTQYKFVVLDLSRHNEMIYVSNS